MGVAVVSTSQGLLTDREAAVAVSAARSCARCGDMSRIGKMPIPVPAVWR
jgi:hypothetical protein